MLRHQDIQARCVEASAHLNARRVDEAEALFENVLAIDPQNAIALHGLGLIAMGKGDGPVARARLEQALASDPNSLIIRINLVDALERLGFADSAEAVLRGLPAALAGFPPALYLSGKLLWARGRYAEALQRFEAASRQAPEIDSDLDNWFFEKLAACDWGGHAAQAAYYDAQAMAGRAASQPFHRMLTSNSPQALARCAQAFTARYIPSRPPIWTGQIWRHERIRIGIVIAELYDHPVAHLLAGVLEHFDRERFELIAFSSCQPVSCPIRDRIVAALDQVVEIGHLDDQAAARTIFQRQIDIAVTLSGYTTGARPGILAHRPAPVQVSYQGFPGTMGAPWIDYLIADRHVIPAEEATLYAEKIVWMPDTYQPTDDKAPIAARAPTRAGEGLPDRAFVFMAYNKSYKITPEMFATWMRILEQVKGSVLWLWDGGERARQNLRREAAGRGIDPGRLVFAAITPDRPDHLARHVLADLFLDTLPYNAHSTASDALWAGLPVLTCRGATFPGRVCAGLLMAAGLEDMVCEDMADYEARAVALAKDAGGLAEIRQRVKTQVRASPLFDTRGYTRRLEAAFATLYETHQAGLAPRSFAVGRAGKQGFA